MLAKGKSPVRARRCTMCDWVLMLDKKLDVFPATRELEQILISEHVEMHKSEMLQTIDFFEFEEEFNGS